MKEWSLHWAYNTGWTVLVGRVRLNCMNIDAEQIRNKFTRKIFALTLLNKNNLTKAAVLFLRWDIQTDVTFQLCVSFIHSVYKQNEQILGKIWIVLHSASTPQETMPCHLAFNNWIQGTRTLQFNKQKHLEGKSAPTHSNGRDCRHRMYPLYCTGYQCHGYTIKRVDSYCKGRYTLSVKLSDFTVWRHTWRKNWVNRAVLTGNSAGLITVLSSRLSHREMHISLRESHKHSVQFFVQFFTQVNCTVWLRVYGTLNAWQ